MWSQRDQVAPYRPEAARCICCALLWSDSWPSTAWCSHCPIAASQCFLHCHPVSERIITATLHTAITPLTVVQVYAPTDSATPEVKDTFYTQLQQQLMAFPEANMLLPMLLLML